jgi:hypothetical protein
MIDVKREKLICDAVKQYSEVIIQQGVHLILIVTDREPYPDALEDLSYLPQVALIIVELRDLVKLLVISQAKKKGIEIDKNLLSRTYESIIEKIGLRSKLDQWIARMSEKGYLLSCEGFVDRTAQACRFFINTIGKSLTVRQSWEYGWKLKNLLPFNIKSEIIPDMGLDELSKHVEILKDYGFLKEDGGKLLLQQHPTESCIIELLEYYGGSTAKHTLAQHFVFREAASRIFDSFLDHMKRKLLLSDDHGNIRLLKPSEIKEIREEVIEVFEKKRSALEQRGGLSFAHILTWKKKGWQLISLAEIEQTVEELLQEIAVADNQDVIRSRTFIVKELVEWYKQYVDKIILSLEKSKENVENLKSEINNTKQKFDQVLSSIVKSTSLGSIKVELQELTEIEKELEEIRQLSETEKSQEELEKMIRPLAGDKETEDDMRKERLWTDVDEELEERGDIRGDWTVAKYVLIKKKIEDVRKRIQELDSMLDSLNKTSQNLVNLVESFLKLFS